MYEICLQDAAIRELGRLDGAAGRRIVNRIRWLAENLENIKPEALTGDLAGFYKLRVGETTGLFTRFCMRKRSSLSTS